MALLRLLRGAGHPQDVQAVGVHLVPLGHLHQCAQVASAGDDTEAGLWVPLLKQRDHRGQRIAGGEHQFGEVIPLTEEIRRGTHHRPPQADNTVQFGQFLRHMGPQGVQQVVWGHP